MKIVISVGSYERILYGIDIDIKKKDEVEIKEAFAIPAHLGYIKCVTSCPRFLASGGTDETVRLFDLKKRKDIGSLSQHQGSVTRVVFSGNSHLLTAGEDGRIGIFRSKDWECLHVLRHKKPINCLAVHPSGKIAMSLGKDGSLKLWNLMTAKQASALQLPNEGIRLVFSQGGTYFAILLCDNTVIVYESDGARRIGQIKCKTRLATLAFLRDESLFYGGEGSIVYWVRILPKTSTDRPGLGEEHSLDTLCAPRIKEMQFVEDILIMGTSSGTIKGIRLNEEAPPSANDAEKPGRRKTTTIFEHKSSLRITSLTATSQ